MKRVLLLRLAVLLSFAAPVVPSWAINVCTDTFGKTIYQDQPCQSVPPVAGNAPIAAKTLTPTVVRDTVKRFNAALSMRDVTTASRFLAPKFKATIEDASGVTRYSRDTFSKLLADVLNAATSYEVLPRCGHVEIQGDEAIVQCELTERLVILKRRHGGTSTDNYRLVLNGGYVQLQAIEAKKH